MTPVIYDVIIVGAGYSGLSASYYFTKRGLTHLVFERQRVGNSWRTQRWDNFRFNSTNLLNVLPGQKAPADPDSFTTALAFVSELEDYVANHQLPVCENSKVISIENSSNIFLVKVLSNGNETDYFSNQVLIASGAANEIRVPLIAKNTSKDITQLHSSEYKHPDQLPDGAVLVVGGAQSGIQITEDLLDAGRKVFFSTSMVGRIPRWYRGRDIFYWVKDAKFYDIRAEDISDSSLLDLKPPHVAGTGDGKTTLSLQSIAKRGAIILGKLDKVEGTNVSFQPNAAEHIKFADDFSENIKKLIDRYIEEHKLTAPARHVDGEDRADTDAVSASPVTFLDLKEETIHAIIWATGFDYDLSYIKLPVFDKTGKLIQKDGVAELPGLYFLGFPWLRSRKSPILFGIIEDVEIVADHIYQYAKKDLGVVPSTTF